MHYVCVLSHPHALHSLENPRRCCVFRQMSCGRSVHAAFVGWNKGLDVLESLGASSDQANAQSREREKGLTSAPPVCSMTSRVCTAIALMSWPYCWNNNSDNSRVFRCASYIRSAREEKRRNRLPATSTTRPLQYLYTCKAIRFVGGEGGET